MAYNRRDLIGHWIRRNQPEQRMCGHACCGGYRVHPNNMPVILPDRLLRRASDNDLAQHYERVSRGNTAEDDAARWQVLYEMDRRDQREQERQAAHQAYRARLAGRQAERAAAVESAYQAAEENTRGNLVNRAGRARGISDRSLFTGGEARARRYATEELLEWWQANPRPSGSMWGGRDTRVYEKATAAKRRQYGTARRAA